MEIGPLPDIRITPAVRPPSVRPQLPAVSDLADAEQARDETVSADAGKSQGGQDDEGCDDSHEIESALQAPEEESVSRINFFA
jgi:hypothetical protein